MRQFAGRAGGSGKQAQPYAVLVVTTIFPVDGRWCCVLAAVLAAGGGVGGFAATGAAEEVAAPPAAVADEDYEPPEEGGDLLKLDAPMRQYFATRVSKHASESERLREIIGAIVLPQGLNLTYDARGTFDVRETFRRRRGNCVSFSFLVVAVAREFGLRASFQSIPTGARWDRYGAVVASASHVNVRVETDAGTYIADLQPDAVPAADLNTMPVIPDQRAWAQFYNNIGFFRLVRGRETDALRYMTKATETDPHFAGGWTNLANVQARLGQLPEARRCYERALRFDSRDLAAAAGLIDVMRRQGGAEDLRRVAKLERKAQRLRDRSPYYQQFLAAQAAAREDWAAAEKILRRAIALKDDEPEFQEQRVAALQHLGRADDVQRAVAKLEKLRKRLAAIPDRIVP